MYRIMPLFLAAVLMWACGESAEQPDPKAACETKECGELCSEAGEPERHCGPEGNCRNFGAEEGWTYCDTECGPCGASCQPPCALGSLCGYAGPGYCNPEGECIIVEDENVCNDRGECTVIPAEEAPRPFDCP